MSGSSVCLRWRAEFEFCIASLQQGARGQPGKPGADGSRGPEVSINFKN